MQVSVSSGAHWEKEFLFCCNKRKAPSDLCSLHHRSGTSVSCSKKCWSVAPLPSSCFIGTGGLWPHQDYLLDVSGANFFELTFASACGSALRTRGSLQPRQDCLMCGPGAKAFKHLLAPTCGSGLYTRGSRAAVTNLSACRSMLCMHTPCPWLWCFPVRGPVPFLAFGCTGSGLPLLRAHVHLISAALVLEHHSGGDEVYVHSWAAVGPPPLVKLMSRDW
eukprot:scaffold111060_cov18-Tisochrysis_lutea.AAC.1